MGMNDLMDMFSPSTVAVIGATEREGAIGRTLFENLVAEFRGTVYPVNPNRESVLGNTCYPDVDAVPAEIDLAVIAIPATATLDVLQQLGDADVDNVVVTTAGFGEAGPEGERLQERLEAIATEEDLALVGPNCLGIISTPVGLNATFAESNPEPGPISFFSQSGGFVTVALDWAGGNGVGFRHVVSLGNEAVLDEADFIDAWGEDEGTEVVLGHVEDIDDGRAFVDLAKEATKSTPVVVVKGGRTEAGARAAASHTGSLAGTDAIYDAAFRQAGVIRADTVEQLFDLGRVFASQPIPAEDSVVVLTNTGGPGVMAADAIGEYDLDLATIEAETRSRLGELLPESAAIENPIDVLGDADAERFDRALEVLLEDTDVGSLVVMACPSGPLEYGELARCIRDRARDTEAPLVTCLMGEESVREPAAELSAADVPNYSDPQRAVRALGALSTYRDVATRAEDAPRSFDVDRERARTIVEEALAAERTQLGSESMALLEAYGIPTPRGEIVEDAAAATAFAEDVGGPVVLKVVSPDVVHKSDVGGVRVDVDPAAVAAEYDDLLATVRAHEPDAAIEGVQVQELVETGDGTETIVGANRDPHFGPVVMFGLGGVFVEVFEDTTFKVAPITETEARSMTEEIQSAPMLRGARGRKPADIESVVDVLQRISQLVTEVPDITELDVNPLVAQPDGVVAIDFRATLDPDDPTP
jgi:acetyltransferase